MSQPAISVIVPVFNGERTLARCLDSVRRQTFADWECVAVNDGSTDGTAALLASVNDPRVRVLTLANGGVSRARNAGLDAARGRAIAFLDCDDSLEPDALETLWALKERTSADIAVAALVMEDACGAPSCRTPKAPPDAPEPWPMSSEEAAACCFAGEPFGGYPHAKLLDASRLGDLRFDTDAHIYEDMLYFLRALTRARSVAYTRRLAHHYTVDGGALCGAMTERKASSLDACERMTALTLRSFPSLADEARLFAARNGLWLLEELSASPRAVRRQPWAKAARSRARKAALSPCDHARLPRVQRFFLACLRLGYGPYFAAYRGLYRPLIALRGRKAA